MSEICRAVIMPHYQIDNDDDDRVPALSGGSLPVSAVMKVRVSATALTTKKGRRRKRKRACKRKT